MSVSKGYLGRGNHHMHKKIDKKSAGAKRAALPGALGKYTRTFVRLCGVCVCMHACMYQQPQKWQFLWQFRGINFCIFVTCLIHECSLSWYHHSTEKPSRQLAALGLLLILVAAVHACLHFFPRIFLFFFFD